MEPLAPILTILAIIVVQGFFTLYFAYFKKLGEYKAINKNIAHITRTTESIKKELDIITENEISFRTERRNTIIKYFESLDHVLTYLTFQMKVHKDDVLQKYIRKVFPSHSAITSKLHLLVESNETTKLVTEIETNIVEILTSAQAIGRLISETIDSGHNSDESDRMIAIQEEHTERIEKLQDRILKQRNELIVRFRQILKQDFSNKQ